MFDSNNSKASGPDGISFHFYQTFCETIQTDIYNLVLAFYNHNINISKLNLATIIQVPKNSECTTVDQFRPISLINFSLKIISKILDNRLAKIMDNLIDPSQTAYI
jgi:hypothetical protein